MATDDGPSPPTATLTPPLTRPPLGPDPRAYRQMQRQMDAQQDRSPPSLTPAESDMRHGWWAGQRAKVIAALQAAGTPARTLNNVVNCGADAVVCVDQLDGSIQTNAIKCHHRFCRACACETCRIIARNLRSHMAGKRCLHVVLTQAGADRPLSDSLDKLTADIAKLRSRKWWKARAAGGTVSLEMTRNADTGQWHPHAHMLVEAGWLDQQQLSDEWRKVTGDSYVVHVSLVNQDDAAIREVTKYLAKTIHRSIADDQASLIELLSALKGRRLITTFGSWRGLALTTVPDDGKPHQWCVVCTFTELRRRAAAGDTWSRLALASLYARWPGRVHTADRPPTPGP